MKENIYCRVCNKQTHLKIDSFSRYHLKVEHPEIKNIREYYDLFIKINNEGKCKTCSKQTEFISYTKGYRDYCSSKCHKNSIEFKELITNSCKHRDYTKVKKKYNQTCMKRYGKNGISQTEHWKIKFKKIMMDKYGVAHPFQLQCVKDKNSKYFDTHMDEINKKRKKYWTKDVIDSHILKIRKTKENKGLIVCWNNLSKWQKYTKLVWRETRRWKKQLFNNWNGKCYYTGIKLLSNEEYIKLYPKHTGRMMNRNKLQPTIDHKISIFWGFKHKIDPKIIGNIKNLCLCSKSSNSKKHNLTEKQFENLK